MIEINAIGDMCPLPIIKAKKVLDKINTKDILKISVDNITSVENLQKMAKELNFNSEVKKLKEDHYDVLIHKVEMNNIIKKNNSNLSKKLEEDDIDLKNKNFYNLLDDVIVISSDIMGGGDEILGRNLLKSFIFTLTEMEIYKSTIIFYNSGAFLPTEGSKSLDDLKNLEQKGVEIITCGACLDYYNLKDKLKVGSITNMYNILERLSKAKKIIKP